MDQVVLDVVTMISLRICNLSNLNLSFINLL